MAEVRETEHGQQIRLVGREYWSHHGHFAPAAPPSPIRTVTRREIVPFTLNEGGGTGRPEVRVIGRFGNVVDVEFGGTGGLVRLNAASLREVARIFNEMAEVLEEG